MSRSIKTLLCILISLFIVVLGAFSIQTVNAASDNTFIEVVDGFDVDNQNFTLSSASISNGKLNLSNGATAITKVSVRNFNLFARIKNDVSFAFNGITIAFSNGACDITGGTVSTNNLTYTASEEVLIRIYSYGSELLVGVRTDSQPIESVYNNLVVVVNPDFDFSTLSISSSSEGYVDYIKLYNLEQEVQLDHEDYDPEGEFNLYQPKDPINKVKGGCSSSFNGVIPVLALVIGGIFVGVKKKND